MNKEQIKKHGEVIKRFCDNPNKGVWAKNINIPGLNDWSLTYSPMFRVDVPCLYVQNDKYAELRKAEADGKIIEYSPCEGKVGAFEKMRLIDRFNRNPKHYRIKPK